MTRSGRIIIAYFGKTSTDVRVFLDKPPESSFFIHQLTNALQWCDELNRYGEPKRPDISDGGNLIEFAGLPDSCNIDHIPDFWDNEE